MERIEYTPKSVCASNIAIEIEAGIIKKLEIKDGCPGNGIGISALCKDQPITEVIKRLQNIPCGGRASSCPNEVARALIEYQDK
jgi:uncharacterized protein (TIGR03905 family)